MKRFLRFIGLALMAQAAAAGASGAQETMLELSGDPQGLIVWSATAGFAPDPAEANGTTYSLVAADPSYIEVQLEVPLPAGVTLRILLEAPPGASSAGVITLSTTPQVAVSSIPPGSYAGLAIQYELSVTTAAGVVPLSTQLVGFTLAPTR